MRRLATAITMGNPLAPLLWDAVSLLMDAVDGRKISSSRVNRFRDEVVWTAIGVATAYYGGELLGAAFGEGIATAEGALTAGDESRFKPLPADIIQPLTWLAVVRLELVGTSKQVSLLVKEPISGATSTSA